MRYEPVPAYEIITVVMRNFTMVFRTTQWSGLRFRRALASATLGLLALLWWSALARTAPIQGLGATGAAGSTLIGVWVAWWLYVAIGEYQHPNRAVPIGWLARRRLERLSVQDPQAAVRAVLPAGWTPFAAGELFNDVMLLVRSPEQRTYAVRIHRGSLDVSGSPEQVLERHAKILNGLQRWQRDKGAVDAFLWLPDQCTSLSLRPHLRLLGASAAVLVAALIEREAPVAAPRQMPTKAPQVTPRGNAVPTAAPTRPSDVPVPGLTDEDIAASHAALRTALPDGWVLVHDVPFGREASRQLQTVLLYRDALALLLHVRPAERTTGDDRLREQKLQQIHGLTGLLSVVWYPASPSTATENVSGGVVIQGPATFLAASLEQWTSALSSPEAA